MAESHKFRTAFNGFNREDVVHYIEFLNKKNTVLVNQLKSENQALKDELAALRKAGDPEKDALIAQLQEKLDQLSANAVPAEIPSPTDSELEAYRRAERMERTAREHSEQVYRQTTAALSEATTQVDGAAQQMVQLADQVSAQISALQKAVDSSKAALQDAAAAMYAIRPETAEE